METSLSDIKDLVTIAKPIIDPIIAAFIKPKIKSLSKWIKKQSVKDAVVDDFFENKFAEYLTRTLHNCEIINILIFQNQQIKTKDIYYPLTIQSSKDQKQYLLNDFKSEYIEPYDKILISDTAGMGKSTLARFITLKTIENNLAIPVLIELRNLKDDHSILDEIFFQLNPIGDSFNKDLIIRFLELGNFLIILDGFDEIHLKGKQKIIKDIRDFINKVSSNQFLLTSRPEESLASFGDFQLFNILPLKESESYELIMKYDSICPIKIGQQLIADIKKNFNLTKELLTNPFLVSLIYSTYTYNKDVPSNKATFYEEIYSALFKRHDLSKGGWSRPKNSNLDILQFKTVLRQLAFDTTIEGTIVYSEPEVLQHILNAKGKCPGIEFNPADYLEDILSSVPLFLRDGLKIKWAHKSLQDYFSADFIAFNSKKEKIILGIYESKREVFLNLLDLFYEIDYKTFRNVVIKNLLLQFIEHNGNSYNDISNVTPDAIKERRAKTFGQTYYFIRLPLNNNDLFDDAFELIRRNHKDVNINLVRTTPFSRIALSLNYFYSLINLLAVKKERFIFDFRDNNDYLTFKLQFQGETLEIDDKPSSPANSQKNFHRVNSILFCPDAFGREFDFPVIDIDLARNELSSINDEIDRDKISNKFLF